MEVQFGPNSIDEPNLLYKIQRKVKVFSTADPLPNRGYNLVASSSKYGLVFVGVPTGTMSVYRLQQLIDKDVEPVHMTVSLSEKPSYLSVSCDHELLAVSGAQKLYIYRVMDIQNERAQPTLTVNYDKSPESFVTAMQWNPCIPDSIALAFYDGTLFVYQASTGQIKKIAAKARCICWSPKGKQLVTGNSDGTLHQFKPDLTPAKAIPAPNLFEGAPAEALAVYWISTYQFAVVYKNAADKSRPSVTIVNTPKGAQPTCLNYEDICYSTGSSRPWYYYLHGVSQWNIILSASSNSMELATIGSADGANWLQWCQPDEARPELPLTDKKQENYPIGICIDSCAIHQLSWGENETLPHMPLLHVVSQSGLLTIFNVINLNKQAAQICSPPTQINLAPEAFTSDIPGEVPKPIEQPTPAAPEPKQVQPTPVPVIPASQPTNQFPAMPIAQPISQFGTTQPSGLFSTSQPTSQFGTTQPSGFSTSQPSSQFGATPPIFNTTAAPIKVPSFTPSAVPTPIPAPEQKEEKPVAKPVQSNVAPPKPQPNLPSEPPKPPPENAAMKAEQEKINKAKENQELKNMLVKEVNDFQNELYNFMLKTRETQAKIQKDIASINSNFNFNSLDTEQLKKECSIDELRSAIVQLKLELVRACAVIAEARSHSNAREFHQWTQADPLTTKRVASIKKLTYYVQTQLDQAQKALDYKWSEASKDSSGPGKRMIRPILDDVYQPLVKQQEILSRQQAVLRTLRKTLSECDVGPAFKSTSLLRSTPFRNKDPLSKLTKNILNMSIEPQNPKQTKGQLSSLKLELLKDALTNHKMVRIKPVNVEMRSNFVSMKEQYDRILKEKIAEVLANSDNTKTAQVVNQPEPPRTVVQYPAPAKPLVEIKQEAVKPPITVPAFSLQSNIKPAPLANVARTLFTDEPKQELPKSQPQEQIKPFSFSKSVLKELLQNKSQANSSAVESPNAFQKNLPEKSESNDFFMGQKICSPTGLSRSSAPTPASPPSAVFTSKPISEMTNTCTKLPTPTFDPKTSAFDQKTSAFDKTTLFGARTASLPTFEAKTAPNLIEKSKQESKPKIQSETGELEPNEPPKSELKTAKPITNLFAFKLTVSTPIPDVLKTTSQEKATVKPIDKLPEKSKENVPKVEEAKTQKEKKEVKPLGAQTANKVVFGLNNSTPTESKTLDLKAESKASESSTEKTEKGVASEATDTPTIATSKPSAFSTLASTPPKEPSPPKSEDKLAESKNSAVSLFGTATATQPKSDGLLSSPGSSIFSSTNLPNAFGAKSVFGSSNLTFGQTTETTASAFAATSVPSRTSDVSITSTAKSETEAPIAVSITTTSVSDSASTPASGSNTAVTSSSAFPTTPTSVLGQTSGAFAPTTTSLFSATSAPTFGQSAFVTTTQASVFETTSTASSVFGAANQAFGSTTPTKPTGSIFGSPTTQAPVFGATSTPSVFDAPTTQTSVFGAPTQTTQASVFGAPSPTTQSSVFGTQSTQASIFGTNQSTQASVFGSPPQTTQASVFGSPTQTTQASVFGTPTPSTQASIFGTPTQTTQASVFGTPTQTTQVSVFGTPTQTTQASVFGTPTQTTQASVFGTPTQTTQASVFGTPTQTTQASVFGGSANSGSIFGGGEANLFASASISTTSAPTGGSVGSIFGGSTGAGSSVFGGSGGNVFGTKTVFGQSNNTAASIFGGSASFGQKAAPNLWAGGSSNAAFGSTAFGQPTTQSSSIFGSGGSFSAPSAGAFSSPQQTNAFGTGESQPASVFGTPQQQSAPAFGGSPVFGSKPAFGQPAGFGSPSNTGGGFGGFGGGFNKSPSGFGAPAAFGGGATFGGTAFGSTSPGKGFGGATASFGSPTQQSNPTFENLAGQNTLTFGSLAQTPQQSQQPNFNTSPSFSGWRG